MFDNKKIFVCCTEQSGDNICYNIFKNLSKYNIIIDGVCGNNSSPYIRKKYFDISDFKSIGFFEIILSLGRYISMINSLSEIIISEQYDLIICIDSPDFNYNLVKKLRKKGYKNNIIQIVAPTVWAWRKNRAEKFSKIYDEIFTLFKFENKYFENKGLKSTFVGHPIFYISAKNNYVNFEKNLIAFLPGSREKEVKKLFKYYEIIYKYLYENKILNYELFIPTLPHLINIINKKIKHWKIKTYVTTNVEEAEKYYSKVLLSLTCSGTASLEISKRLIPQIVIYKLNFFTILFFKLFVKIKYANLINIFSNKMIIDEVVNFKLNKRNLLNSFKLLLFNKKYRENQVKEVKQNLSLFETKEQPFKVMQKRIKEIISKAN